MCNRQIVNTCPIPGSVRDIFTAVNSKALLPPIHLCLQSQAATASWRVPLLSHIHSFFLLLSSLPLPQFKSSSSMPHGVPSQNPDLASNEVQQPDAPLLFTVAQRHPLLARKKGHFLGLPIDMHCLAPPVFCHVISHPPPLCTIPKLSFPTLPNVAGPWRFGFLSRVPPHAGRLHLNRSSSNS